MIHHKLLIILFAISAALPIKAEQSNFRFINLANYLRLTGSQRKSYTKGLQLAIAELEASLQRNGMDVSHFDLLNSVLPRAFAAPRKGAWQVPKCIIGGVIRTTNNGNCPTFGRGCKPLADGFQCGKIYGKEACINRLPTETISKRCEEKGRDYQIPSDAYAAISQDLESGINDVCVKAPEKGQDVCDKFWSRVNELNEKYNKPPPPPSCHGEKRKKIRRKKKQKTILTLKPF